MDYSNFYTVGISLGLGLLVGLQREQSNSLIGGIRTFPLITILGTLTAFVATYFESPWILGFGLFSVAILTLSSNYLRAQSDSLDDNGSGQTTEAALLLMYVMGAYLVIGNQILAVVLTGMIAVLLHLKPFLSQLIDRLGKKDTQAIMQFVVIVLVVLPILPDTNFGPYNVINLREIWTMVSLIVGISVIGYFVYKIAGDNLGAIAGGLLGGLISSTATTVSYAKRTSGAMDSGILAALVIMLASAVSVLRILLEVFIVIPGYFLMIALPIALVVLVMGVLCVVIYFRNKENPKSAIPEPGNPAQIKSALLFGGLYLLILLIVAWAKDQFGNSGLYVVSIISGLTDVDAITLSLSNAMKSDSLPVGLGWKLILVAAMSNMAFKVIMAAILGNAVLRRALFISGGIVILAGILVVFFWPG